MYIEHNENDEKNWRYKYMVKFMMDVTYSGECIQFVLFILVGCVLLYFIISDLRFTKSSQIRRCNEKQDIITIKLLLLINIVFQILSYLISCIGLSMLTNCDQNNYFVITIIGFMFNLGYIVCLQILCWRSILIWGQLLCYKLQIEPQFINYLKKIPIGDVFIIVMNVTIFIIYFTGSLESLGILNLLISIISTLIMILFVAVSILFQKHILPQSQIPQLTRRRVKISSLLLIIAFSLRITWNLFIMLPGTQHMFEKLKCDIENTEINCDDCSTKNSYSWLIYNSFYIPIVNLIPVFLFNRIYSPQRNIIQNKVNRLIDDYE